MNYSIPYPLPGFADPVSSWLHLLGAGVALVLTFFLVAGGRGGWAKISLAIFGFSVVFLLSMSGTFHLLPRDTAGRDVLMRLDHAGIFFLIAGTFTPIHLILFTGWKRWLPLTLVWVCAITGITLKTIFFTDIPEGLGISFYLGLGWVGAISCWLLYHDYGASALELPVTGGLAYTIGAVLEFLRWPVVFPGIIGPHELFHVAVLIGVAAFWKFIAEASQGKLARKESPPIAMGGLSEIV